VAFSPDGALLATASDDGTVGMWDLATDTMLTSLRGHTDWIFDLAFSPDGALLATASNDGAIRVWGVEDGVARATLVQFSEAGYAAWSAAGYKLDGDDVEQDLWWVIKLCRFAPGELDPFVPGLRRLPREVPIMPLSAG
jgi:predicted NACHT family NTPase